MNLHEVKIESDDYKSEYFQEDFGVTSNGGNINVYFKNLEQELINKIEEADIVVGCVAWITSKPILEALSKKRAVAIVVQKEDFLRPDMDSNNPWKKQLRGLYSKLPDGLSRYDDILKTLKTQLYSMSYCGDSTIESIRCVGNYNSDKNPAFPRSHHKFVLFCKGKKIGDDWQYQWQPYQVWTGSFNFTKNATASFENALVIDNQDIVNAYFREWAQIEALSEPLNWESNWVAPEWRIGS